MGYGTKRNRKRLDDEVRDRPNLQGTRRVERPSPEDAVHEGAPSVESENAPGSPEDERGTRGLQGKFRRDDAPRR